MKFSIAIERGSEKTAFGVVVPDLPGCYSAGDTLEEAFDNAREAIMAACEFSNDAPEPKPIDHWQDDPEYAGWMWGIVDVPVEKYFGPAEKINITVPAKILKRIDDHAQRVGDTRSGFLVRAAERAISQAASEPKTKRPAHVTHAHAHKKTAARKR